MRVVVKVGSSTLTRADGRLDLAQMATLSYQLAGLLGAGHQMLLVTSGAVAAGMGRLGRSHQGELVAKQALAAVGQSMLMETYAQFLGKEGYTVAQILLTQEDFSLPVRKEAALATMEQLLAWGVLPIINENDSVAVEEIRFGDNDRLSAQVAVLLGAELLVILSDIDGLYSADPRHHADAKRLAVVEEISERLRAAAGRSGALGSGGMVTKLQAAEVASTAGIPMLLAHGREASVLPRALAGEPVGTWFRLPVPSVRKGAGEA